MAQYGCAVALGEFSLSVIWVGLLPHCCIDSGVSGQHSRLEADLGVDFEVVLVHVFSANRGPDPGIGGGIEEVARSIVEVIETPDVFEVWELAFRKVSSKEFLEAGVCQNGTIETIGKMPLPSICLV